ncbi:MAG: aminoglycoside 3'-phosphotransferase, partial [Actinomycetia bacterium]|nr:aminoglycoside 3'-phosphotransferase [Actinomycetes bacterium]
MLAGVPTGPTEVPAAVGTLAAGRPIIPVWENQLGGLTFAVDQALFVKWNPHGNGIDLGSEIDRLGWAARYVTVPVVVDLGSDDDGTWFASNALDATNAVTERWRQEPAAAVRAIGCG